MSRHGDHRGHDAIPVAAAGRSVCDGTRSRQRDARVADGRLRVRVWTLRRRQELVGALGELCHLGRSPLAGRVDDTGVHAIPVGSLVAVGATPGASMAFVSWPLTEEPFMSAIK